MLLTILSSLYGDVLLGNGAWTDAEMLWAMDVSRTFLVSSLVRVRVAVKHSLVDLSWCVSAFMTYE